jgi:hypothetical protein
VLALPSIECALPLQEIYARVELLAEEKPTGQETVE